MFAFCWKFGHGMHSFMLTCGLLGSVVTRDGGESPEWMDLVSLPLPLKLRHIPAVLLHFLRQYYHSVCFSCLPAWSVQKRCKRSFFKVQKGIFSCSAGPSFLDEVAALFPHRHSQVDAARKNADDRLAKSQFFLEKELIFFCRQIYILYPFL